MFHSVQLTTDAAQEGRVSRTPCVIGEDSHKATTHAMQEIDMIIHAASQFRSKTRLWSQTKPKSNFGLRPGATFSKLSKIFFLRSS